MEFRVWICDKMNGDVVSKFERLTAKLRKAAKCVPGECWDTQINDTARLIFCLSYWIIRCFRGMRKE